MGFDHGPPDTTSVLEGLYLWLLANSNTIPTWTQIFKPKMQTQTQSKNLTYILPDISPPGKLGRNFGAHTWQVDF